MIRLCRGTDRSGNFDLYIQPVEGGKALRLTTDPVAETSPVFSPDGKKIAFRSERDGGGIYEMPLFGGEPRLLVQAGRNPQYSPDGKWIAWWEGEPDVVAQTMRGGGSVFVMPAEGGPRRQLGADLVWAAYPIFNESSSAVMFRGVLHKNRNWLIGEYFTASVEGSPSLPIGLESMGWGRGFRKQNLMVNEINAWRDQGVIFTGTAGQGWSTWWAEFDQEEGRIAGPARRLTSGATQESHVAVAPGRIALFSGDYDVQIWTLPIVASKANATGPLRQLTTVSTWIAAPAISGDGRYIAYSKLEHDAKNPQRHDLNIILKDAVSGSESNLTSSPSHENHPQFLEDGVTVVYTLENKDVPLSEDGLYTSTVFRQGITAGRREQIADWGDTRYAASVSKNLRWMVRASPGPALRSGESIVAYETATGRSGEITSDGRSLLMEIGLSPDEKWMCFATDDAGRRRVFVAPFRGLAPIEADEWVAIETRSGYSDNPVWSPDGAWLYFLSDRDGSRCVWAQRLDTETKRPRGEPEGVLHLHNPSLRPYWGTSLAVSEKSLVIILLRLIGGIWVAQLPGAIQ